MSPSPPSVLPTEAPGTPFAFDLSSMSTRQMGGDRITRRLQAMCAALATVSAGLIFFLEVTPPTAGRLPSAATLVVIGLLAAFFIVSVVGLLGVGPGAVECSVDGRGITLRYQNGRAVRYGWFDPKFSVNLAVITGRSETRYDFLTHLPFHNPLSKEAFETLVAQGEQHGLAVESSMARSGDVTVQTYRLRTRG